MTKSGLEALVKEHDKLVNEKRPDLIERLSNARSQGDLSENSDYLNAKEELEFMDGRISELDGVIKNAQVVKTNGKANGVAVGTTITVKYNGNKHDFQMVGEWEADPVNRKISPECPLGKALFGKKVGDKVEVEAPAGKVVYEILRIK